MMDKTIVDIAVADGRFNTLVAAVTAAELVDTLKSEGPFTVFAPPMMPSMLFLTARSKACSCPRTNRL